MSRYADTLTQENIDNSYIYIVTGSTIVQTDHAYLVDDFMIKSDKAGDGTFYDDYNLVRKENISPTATEDTYLPVNIEDAKINALYQKYADKFKIGGTLTDDIVKETKTLKAGRNLKVYERLFKKHFNTASSNGYFKIEGMLKPENLSTYDFTDADTIMKLCRDSGIEVVGHALVWDRQRMYDYFYTGGETGTPKYDREHLLAFMRNYIKKVMNHFNGKGDPSEYKVDGYSGGGVTTWDVLNEACDRYSDTIEIDYYKVKDGPFSRIIGNDYGKYAFKYAHETDPDAELRYNDFGEHNAAKARAVAAYVKSLTDPNNSAVSYVDKIGAQSHYYADSDIDTIKESLDRYIATGLKLDITELDIRAYTKAEFEAKKQIYEDGVPKSVEYKQAKLLRELFDKYELLSDKIDRVNFWTFTDLYAYPNTESFDHKEYAGIFDRKFAPKPQYYILVDTEEEFNARYPDYASYVQAP